MATVVEIHSRLEHLTPSARKVATLSDEQRIRRIRSDRWIGYPRALEALDELYNLANWPTKQRMPNLLIVGPTNNGKSMIIEKFRRMKEMRPKSEEHREVLPLVVVQMPSDPSINRFYTALIASTDTPMGPRLRRQDLEHMALAVLRGVGTRMLIIDELHNILAGPTKAQREFLNLLRFLGNELRIPIVGVGTQDAYLAIRSDDQLENRFEPFALPRWREGPELMSLLASFAASYPLKQPSSLGTEEVARYVLARSEGTIGEMAKFMSQVAIAAIEDGSEAIGSSAFANARYSGPTERRQEFERLLA